MRGQNPAVQWKWGTFPARLREEGPVFQTPDVQRCKDRVQEKTAVFGVVANICLQAFASSLSVETVFPKQAWWVWMGNNSVSKASKRSLNREQQCSQTKRDEFEQGTTVFPKWALGVWMGNNSVPKASARSLNGEQQCSQSEQEEFEQGTAVFPKWVRGVWTGTTVLQSEHKEFEQGTAVFPKQMQGVWTGNNSVPKASVRSLDREQCERCL